MDMNRAAVDALSIKEIKRELQERGSSLVGLIERSEFVDALVAARFYADPSAHVVCKTCGSGEDADGNEILLCDERGCSAAHHMRCLLTPLHAVPPGEWFCPDCASRTPQEARPLRKRSADEALGETQPTTQQSTAPAAGSVGTSSEVASASAVEFEVNLSEEPELASWYPCSVRCERCGWKEVRLASDEEGLWVPSAAVRHAQTRASDWDPTDWAEPDELELRFDGGWWRVRLAKQQPRPGSGYYHVTYEPTGKKHKATVGQLRPFVECKPLAQLLHEEMKREASRNRCLARKAAPSANWWQRLRGWRTYLSPPAECTAAAPSAAPSAALSAAPSAASTAAASTTAASAAAAAVTSTAASCSSAAVAHSTHANSRVPEVRRSQSEPRELLIFSCSPKDANLPGLDDEAAEVTAAIGSFAADVRHQRGGDDTDLNAALCAKPCRSFLFCGHAHANLPTSDGVRCPTLVFTNRSGGMVTVEPATLASMLGQHTAAGPAEFGRALELVFLNGCCSEPLGRALLGAGVPTVICWRTKVASNAARIFAVAFFREHKRNGRSVEASFAQASLAVTQPKKVVCIGGARTEVQRFALRDPCAPPFSEAQPDRGDPRRALAAGVPVFLSATATSGPIAPSPGPEGK